MFSTSTGSLKFRLGRVESKYIQKRVSLERDRERNNERFVH